MIKNFDINEYVRPNILAMKAYSSARDEFKESDTDMIFLDANENPFENGVNRYPDPQQRDLKQLLGQQKGLKTNQVLLGNGSDEVLDLIFRVFCEPNRDNVITLPPTYGMYNVLAELNAIENRKVLLTADFEPDVEGIIEASNDRTKLLLLCTPNNPTGNSFSEERITQLLESFKGLVVIDEAYIDFSKNGSWITKLANYKNLIVTQTLSKAYGMAGIRLGICYASEEIIALLNKIKPPYNVNQLTQERALNRLKNISEINSEIASIIDQKKVLYKCLLELNFIRKIYRSDANFILIKVDNADKRYSQLLAKGIVIRNRSNQPLCENTLRITVGTESETKQLIKTLKSIE